MSATRPLNICCYNGFTFHYEMFGYLLHWVHRQNKQAKSEIYRMSIFTPSKNNYGWLAWYQTRYPKTIFMSPEEFPTHAHKYDLIFLTTDDDPTFTPEYLALYSVAQRIIKVNHVNWNRRPDISKYINIRPYLDRVEHETHFSKEPGAWKVNVYHINYADLDCQDPDRHPYHALPSYHIRSKKNFNGLIRIYVGDGNPGRLNDEDIATLAFQHNVKLYFVGRSSCYYRFPYYNNKHPIQHKFLRQVDTAKMIKTMQKCHYYFYGLNADNSCNQVAISGHLPLAFSCGTRVIMTRASNKYYGFKSALCYEKITDILPLTYTDNMEVLAERKECENNLHQAITAQFPHLFESVVAIPPTLSTPIPKRIHMMWLTDRMDIHEMQIPSKYDYCRSTWTQHNPDWTLDIWSLPKVRELLKEYFPQHLAAFDKTRRIITKCDIARFCVVAVFGGLYCDLDFYCRKSMNEIVAGKDIMLIREVPEHEDKDNKLYNGIFAAVPQHPFLLGWIERMFANIAETPDTIDFVEHTTSPVAFQRYYMSSVITNSTKIQLTETCRLMPYTDKNKLSSKCLNTLDPETFTVWHEGSNWFADEMKGRWIIIVLIIIFILLLLLVAYMVWRRSRSPKNSA